MRMPVRVLCFAFCKVRRNVNVQGSLSDSVREDVAFRILRTQR